MVTITGDCIGEVLMSSGIGARHNCLAKEVDCGEDGAEVGETGEVGFGSARVVSSVEVAGSGSVRACINALVTACNAESANRKETEKS